MAITAHDDYSHQILDELEHDRQVSQRALARRVGIALGLTNLLMRRLVRRGFVRMIRVKPHRVRYLLTPAGLAEKARMSNVAFQKSVQRYRHARDRVRVAFDRLSAKWTDGGSAKPVVFYGTGEVAEIGYICLQGTDLRLVAAVDDRGCGSFFDVLVVPPESLSTDLLDARGAARLVVMSLRPSDELRAEIAAAGIPPGRVIWV